MKKPCFVTALLSAPLLLAFNAVVEGLRFEPEEGATLTKTFVTVTDMALDDLSLIVDGQDVAAMMGGLEMSLRTEQSVTVTDEYMASKSGRPVKLARTFDSLSALTSVGVMGDFGSQDQEIDSTSELEGLTALFSWNAESGEYDITYKDDEEEGDQDLLEGLTEDMDLRVFLPGKDVSEGDTWKVEITELGGLNAPGGNLMLIPEGQDVDQLEMFSGIFENFADELADLFEGTCVCTYKGNRDVDGEKLGEIQVALEISSNADLSELLSDVLDSIFEEFGMEETPTITIDAADLNMDFEGEGVLLWNEKAGRVQSFEISGDIVLAMEFNITGEMDGEGGTAEISLEMSGVIEQTVETE